VSPPTSSPRLTTRDWRVAETRPVTDGLSQHRPVTDSSSPSTSHHSRALATDTGRSDHSLHDKTIIPTQYKFPNISRHHQSTEATQYNHHTTTTILRPFFRDHPGESVPEENFWISRCKGRLTKADTPTSQLGATPSRLTSAHLHHPPYFFTGQIQAK